MECYWKTILLLLAVIIQSSNSDTTTELSSTMSQTTNISTTLETSTKISSTAEKIPKTTTSSVMANTTSEQITVSITSSSSVPSSASYETTKANTNTSSTDTTVETSTSSIEKTSPSAAANYSTSSTPLTTTNTSPSTLTTIDTSSSTPLTSNNPPLTPTTANTPPPTLTTNNSPSITTAISVETTPATPSLGIVISETNLLLTNDSSRYFVEIQVSKNVHIDNIWLVIQNASTDGPEGLLLNDYINISSIDSDPYVYKNDTISDKLMGLDSVLIALYAEEVSAGNLTTKGLHDVLLYSSSGNISLGLKELFVNILSQNLIIDYETLNISVPFSLSRCSDHDVANSAVVLTPESPGKKNSCNFNVISPLEMKLTMKDQPCSHNLPTDFRSALKNCVISQVNEDERCGLTAYMMTVTEITPGCISDGTELHVRFTVNSSFPDQGKLIMNGYINFLHQQRLTIKGEYYYLTNCFKDCFDGTTPPTNTDDNRIRVTVAVVVSCIGVFLLVLLFVVLYLRRKRRGILQFHMTRLDEDDDLAGDMDDFVGNQGATFRNYR